jgi:GT2 family glycosyltransferase
MGIWSEQLLPTDQVRPDISIVIISYNTLEMTRDCLLSVFRNIGKLASQVIVVDNDSKDGSAQMVRNTFPEALLIANDRNLGFAAANNQGFRLASGEYILLLNSDTVVLGDVLERSVEYMRANSAVGAMGCRVLNTDRTMQETCSGYPTLGRLFMMTMALDRLPGLKTYDRYLLRGWQRDSERDVEVISGCYLLVRRLAIAEVGGLDENFFFFGEETDWCLSMRKAGWQLKFAPVGEIIHHGGGSVKKLNYRRDVMLTEATIRLHKKNGGVISAVIAFVILAVFNFSRAVIWTLCALIQPTCHTRALHFRQVSAHTLEAWPQERGK